MAGVNKNFVVKNGLEVDSFLILADADNNRVGINTNDIKYSLHVNGGIGATTLYATGISTFKSVHLDGTVIAGNAGIGSTGQYLVRIGTGVTWQNLPATRSSQTFTATAGQTIFSFTYTVGQLDVFINGVKLSPSEYTANDTASVILNTACFGDETVELISYSSVNPGYGFTGIYGISLFEEGSPVGTTGQVVTLNFVGSAVTATATGAGATIYINDSVNPNYWGQTAAGIHTLSNVGLGTTNPRFALEVGAVGASGTSLWVNGNARVTGILTVGSSSIVLDGANNTINVGSGITINGNTGIVSASNFFANGIQVGVISATTIVYQGATLSSSQWVSTATGIHTLSAVGIGTTNPTSKLTVQGDVSVSGVSTFSNNVRVSGIVTANSVLVSNDGGKNGSVLIEDTGAYSQITFRASNGTDQTQIQGVEANLYVLPGGTGYIGLADATTNLFYPNGNVILNNGANGTTTLGNGVQITGLTSTTSLRVGTGGTVINATAEGLVGIGTTNPTSALTVKGNTSLETLSVSGVSTFVGLTTFKNYVTITELGSSSYDGIRFISGSNFAIVSSDSLGNLIINSQSTNNRTVEINGYSQFYANSGNVQLNNGNSGTTKVGSAITFTSNTGEIFTTGNVRVGVSTAAGVILTSPNGTKYQLFVEDDGTLKTVAV